MTRNSFHSRDQLTVDETSYIIHRLDRIDGAQRLPYSLKVLLENLLRNEDGDLVTAEQIRALAGWQPDATPSQEIQYTPARVLMQDFTGVPGIVDLVAMRDAIGDLGGDARRINPQIPTELVIDHSVIVDDFGRSDAFLTNATKEFERNAERYQLLRWGHRRSTISRWCRRIPASATRSIWSIWRVQCSPAKPRTVCSRIRTPWWAPTRIPP